MRLGSASAEQPAYIRVTTRRHFPTRPLPSSQSHNEAHPPLIRESEATLTSCAPYQARSPLRATDWSDLLVAIPAWKCSGRA